MRIKKHPSGNEYVFSGQIWVRNFTKPNLVPLLLTHLFQSEDYKQILQNEEMNKNFPMISDEKIVFKKALIISDGFDFDKHHKILSGLDKDVGILAINGALKKWTLTKVEPKLRRTINAYVINNPYQEAFKFMPAKNSGYFPVCVASTRTNFEFLRKYLGDVYTYAPTPEVKFGKESKETYHVDDYRNPICAALDLAYHLGAQKIAMMCCDDSFPEKRDAAIQLKNGLYAYSQQLRSQRIIDAKLYWLTHIEDREIKVVDSSSGTEYKNATYISPEDVLKFFKEETEDSSNAK